MKSVKVGNLLIIFPPGNKVCKEFLRVTLALLAPLRCTGKIDEPAVQFNKGTQGYS